MHHEIDRTDFLHEFPESAVGVLVPARIAENYRRVAAEFGKLVHIAEPQGRRYIGNRNLGSLIICLNGNLPADAAFIQGTEYNPFFSFQKTVVRFIRHEYKLILLQLPY